MHVLILDAQQRSALAAARSLGRQGVRVTAADSSRPNLTSASRYVASHLNYPDPTREPAAFCDWVRGTVRTLRPQVVMPMTDVTTMVLAPIQDELRPTALACGPHHAYEQLSDKGLLLQLATAAGLKVPVTTTLHSLSEVEQHVASCAFPLVLKPARSKVLLNGRVLSTSVFVARNASEAVDRLRAEPWFPAKPCLAQQFIEGDGAGVFALYWAGAPLAWFAHRRVREKPPSGGVSVLCESVPPDAQLRSLSERLLTAAGWHGPAMVEFRIARDGTPYVMEVNCRFWGSLQLSIDSGVDFPWLFFQRLIGREVAPAAQYRVGQRLRWLLGDVDNLIAQARDRERSAAQKRKAVSDFFRTFFDGSVRQEIFRWSDPGPAARELMLWLRALA